MTGFPKQIFSSYPSDFYVSVRDLGWKTEAQISLKNKQGTYVPLCDFTLAQSSEELTLKAQTRSTHQHVQDKYLDSLSIQVLRVTPLKYGINRVNVRSLDEKDGTCDGSVEVQQRVVGNDVSPSRLWKKIYGHSRKDFDFYKKLIIFKRSLKEGMNQHNVLGGEYIPCFVDISNMIHMINQNLDPNEGEAESLALYGDGSEGNKPVNISGLEQEIFLDYSKLDKILSSANRPVSFGFHLGYRPTETTSP